MSTATASPPELSTIEIDVDGEIGTMTLNRPDVLNAMNPEMIGELVVAASLAGRPGAPARPDRHRERPRVLGRRRRHLVREGARGPEEDLPSGVRRGADVLHQAIVDFRRIPYPVVAAVNGVAAGAGFSLALMCDTRIASEEAMFVCAYGRIGASPDGGMTYFLPRVLGPARAVELLLNDPNLSAEAALGAGLVAEIVEPDALADRAREKATKLAAKAPHYVRMCKRLVGQSLDDTLADHLQLERHGIADSMETRDLREGVTAFLEGREAIFTGQ